MLLCIYVIMYKFTNVICKEETMGLTLCFYNFKGGVGKTSTTALTAYNMAKRLNKKVLVVDCDGQANLTALYMKTKFIDSDIKEYSIDNTLMNSIVNNTSLQDIIIPITENLDLVPNAFDFSMYSRFLDKNVNSEDEKLLFLHNKLLPLKNIYDYIFLDVPPNLSLPNDSAFIACDQIIVVLQTQERSLSGAEVFINYLIETLSKDAQHLNTDINVLGIIPVLSKPNAPVDYEVIRSAKEIWGEQWIFKNQIKLMERIKRMDMQGITDNTSDIHDKNVHEKFLKVAEEIIERLEIE